MLRPIPLRSRRRLTVGLAACLFVAIPPVAGWAALGPLDPIEEQPAVGEAAQLVTPVTQPVTQVAEPLTQVVQPASQEVEPVTQSVEAVTQAAEPVTQPVQQGVQAVTQAAEPVTQPVQQGVQAVTQAAEPVTQPAQHVVEPVEQAVGAAVASPDKPDARKPDVAVAADAQPPRTRGPAQTSATRSAAGADGTGSPQESAGLPSLSQLPSGYALPAQQQSLAALELASLICWLPGRLGLLPGLPLVDSLLADLGLAVPLDAPQLVGGSPFTGAASTPSNPVDATAPASGGLLDAFSQPFEPSENSTVVFLALLAVALVLIAVAALPRRAFRIGMLSAVSIDLRYYAAASGLAIGLSVGVAYILSRIQ
jgi:hypothetical protein